MRGALLVLAALLFVGCSGDHTTGIEIEPGEPPMATLGTETIRPDGDTYTDGYWSFYGAGFFWTSIIEDPNDYDTTSYSYVSKATGLGKFFTVSMGDFQGNEDATIVSMTCRVLYKCTVGGDETCTLSIQAEPLDPFTFQQATEVTLGESTQYGLSLTPAQVNNIQLSPTAGGDGWTKNTRLEVYGVELELTYIYDPGTGIIETVTATSTATISETATSTEGATQANSENNKIISIESLIE